MSIKLNIAGNLKRLRKQREITQEDLASFIGVSFQAVSKWERGEGYPDITTLPIIANFFNVSLDELIGMNEIKNQAKLEEIEEQHDKLTAAGKIKEDIELLREAIKLFPNDYLLLSELACYLDGYGKTNEEKKKNRDEAIKISQRIKEFCPDPAIRSNVGANMCFSLFQNGNKDMAVSLAKKLPNIYKTRDFTLNRFLERDEQINECQKSIQKLVWGLWWQSNLLAERYRLNSADNNEHYTAREVIKIYNKAIDIFNLIYDEGDYYFAHSYLMQSYEHISQAYYKLGEFDKTISNLEKAAGHSVAFVMRSNKHSYTSLLLNTVEDKAENSSRYSEKNDAYHLKKWITECYVQILNDERVQKILTELEKYANLGGSM